jgi:hypothetical protein
MRTTVILESYFNVKLTRRLLDDEAQSIDIEFTVRSPMSTLYSSARTHLAVLSEPVALVLDAGSNDPAAVTRRRQSAEEVIGDAAARAPFLLLLAVPYLQSLLFMRPALMTRAFGDRANDGGRSQELGRLSPRDAYKRLVDPGVPEEFSFLTFFQALDDDDIAALRQESPVRELIAFVTEVGSPVASATASP